MTLYEVVVARYLDGLSNRTALNGYTTYCLGASLRSDNKQGTNVGQLSPFRLAEAREYLYEGEM